MHLLVRAMAPLLALLALVMLVSALAFAFSTHDLAGFLVLLIVLVLVLDALAFGVLAWASATPGPTWRTATLALIAINLVATFLDQVGALDIVVILLLVVTALAAFVTPRGSAPDFDD